MSPMILLYIALILIIVIGGTVIAWRAMLSRRSDSTTNTGPLPRAGRSFEQQAEGRQDTTV